MRPRDYYALKSHCVPTIASRLDLPNRNLGIFKIITQWNLISRRRGGSWKGEGTRARHSSGPSTPRSKGRTLSKGRPCSGRTLSKGKPRALGKSRAQGKPRRLGRTCALGMKAGERHPMAGAGHVKPGCAGARPSPKRANLEKQSPSLRVSARSVLTGRRARVLRASGPLGRYAPRAARLLRAPGLCRRACSGRPGNVSCPVSLGVGREIGRNCPGKIGRSVMPIVCREVLLYFQFRETVAMNCDPPVPDVKDATGNC